MFFQVLVGRGDASEINLDNLISSYSRYFALLEDSQKIRLCLQADIADFIQKHRAALCDLEFPFLAILRAGERSLFVTKEFAFEQCLSQCAAVNRHQRMKATQACGMDGSNHQFLASPAFAGNQNIGIGRPNCLDRLDHFPHCRASADKIAGIRRLRYCSS